MYLESIAWPLSGSNMFEHHSLFSVRSKAVPIHFCVLFVKQCCFALSLYIQNSSLRPWEGCVVAFVTFQFVILCDNSHLVRGGVGGRWGGGGGGGRGGGWGGEWQ